MFQWIPYFGSNTLPVDTVDVYAVRSGHGLGLGYGYDLRRADLDYGLLRKLTAEWRDVIRFYYGDFYPLTPYGIAEEDWLGWQFDLPEEGTGLVQVFRRKCSTQDGRVLRLQGLDGLAQVEVTDLDTGVRRKFSGQELMDQGLPITITQQPGAALLTYRRV
jgi:hypothetical protein